MSFNFLFFIYYFFTIFIFYILFYFLFVKKNTFKRNFCIIYVNQNSKEISSKYFNFSFLNKMGFGVSKRKYYSKKSWQKIQDIKVFFDEKYIYFESFLGDFVRVNKLSQIRKIITIKKKEVLIKFKSGKNLPILIKFNNKKDFINFLNFYKKNILLNNK